MPLFVAKQHLSLAWSKVMSRFSFVPYSAIYTDVIFVIGVEMPLKAAAQEV
jgi:hypothetical protein